MLGPKGKKGNEGSRGQGGLPGMMGTQGPQRRDGVEGQTGDKGAQGMLGQKGEKGNEGPRGKNEPPGIMGIKRARGMVGDQGIKGDKGEKGESVTNPSSAVPQTNWKQCVWKADDGRDSGKVKVREKCSDWIWCFEQNYFYPLMKDKVQIQNSSRIYLNGNQNYIIQSLSVSYRIDESDITSVR